MARVDADKRLVWLRSLRRFKTGVRVRAKLGVIDAICQQVAEYRKKNKWECPCWEHERWVTLLYTCIKNDTYPPELLEGFVKTAEVTFLASRRQPTTENTLKAVDQVCAKLSVALRCKFDVFI